MKHLRRRRLAGILIITGVMWSVFGLLTNGHDVQESVRHISWARFGLVLLLSMVNYGIRLLRFHWLTRVVATRPTPLTTNGIIYFSGLSMNLTPARVGEVIKAYFQQRLFGESFARMAPIAFFERLTDGLAMLLLMSVGVLAFQIGTGFFIGLIALFVIIVAILHLKSLGRWIVRQASRFPMLKPMAVPLDRALASSFELSQASSLTGGALLGLLAWAIEASGLWVLVGSGGVPLTAASLYRVWFVFSASAAAGFLSIFPGGLGVNELSTIGLLERLVGLGYADALVVTFAFRLVTLWLGVILGLISVVILERRMKS